MDQCEVEFIAEGEIVGCAVLADDDWAQAIAHGIFEPKGAYAAARHAAHIVDSPGDPALDTRNKRPGRVALAVRLPDGTVSDAEVVLYDFSAVLGPDGREVYVFLSRAEFDALIPRR